MRLATAAFRFPIFPVPVLAEPASTANPRLADEAREGTPTPQSVKPRNTSGTLAAGNSFTPAVGDKSGAMPEGQKPDGATPGKQCAGESSRSVESASPAEPGPLVHDQAGYGVPRVLISPPTGGVWATVASIRPDAKADPTPRGADNCCGLPGAAAKGVSPSWGFIGLAESQSRSRLFHPTVRLRQCRAELSPARTVRRLARDSVTAIASHPPRPPSPQPSPQGEGEEDGATAPRLAIAHAPPLPAKPCPKADEGPCLVRYAGEAISFEVSGGRVVAFAVKDAEASVFVTKGEALRLARAAFGDLSHVTIEPKSNPA